jgi:hypothetical protein
VAGFAKVEGDFWLPIHLNYSDRDGYQSKKPGRLLTRSRERAPKKSRIFAKSTEVFEAAIHALL